MDAQVVEITRVRPPARGDITSGPARSGKPDLVHVACMRGAARPGLISVVKDTWIDIFAVPRSRQGSLMNPLTHTNS